MTKNTRDTPPFVPAVCSTPLALYPKSLAGVHAPSLWQLFPLLFEWLQNLQMVIHILLRVISGSKLPKHVTASSNVFAPSAKVRDKGSTSKTELVLFCWCCNPNASDWGAMSRKCWISSSRSLILWAYDSSRSAPWHLHQPTGQIRNDNTKLALYNSWNKNPTKHIMITWGSGPSFTSSQVFPFRIISSLSCSLSLSTLTNRIPKLDKLFTLTS